MEMMDTLINGMLNESETVLAVGREAMMAVFIVSAVISLLLCLFGLKMIRVWNVLCALALGAGAGLAVSVLLGTNVTVTLIVSGVAAVILAVLAGIFKKFGAFLFCLITIFGVMVGVINPENWILIAVCGAVGLLAAIAAMLWFEPLVIIVTAVNGGFGLGNAILGITGLDNLYISLTVYIIPVILGLAVQFMMKSREIGKKEAKRAHAIKEEISKEAEVEQARAILDLNEDEEDEED